MFEDKMFYIKPPTADATPEQWEEWLKKDAAKRRGAKAAATRRLEYAETPEDLQATGMRRVDGRWQQCLSIGFSGSADDDTLQGEVAVDATQEREAVIIRMKRGDTKRGRRTQKQKEARRKKSRKNAKRRRTQAQQKAAAARKAIK